MLRSAYHHPHQYVRTEWSFLRPLVPLNTSGSTLASIYSITFRLDRSGYASHFQHSFRHKPARSDRPNDELLISQPRLMS